jgi:hypothetical protein
MIKVLVPVFIVAIIALTVWAVTRNESKVGELKRLREENKAYKILVDILDRDAYAEYTVTNSPFAGNVLDAIRRHDSSKKEIA